MQLEEAIAARHSTRQFLPNAAVPRAVLAEALRLAAAHAPSNSNIQPWRLFAVRGAARDRLADRLHARAAAALAAGEDPSPNTTLPPACQAYRAAVGALIYGPQGLGVARDDVEGRAAAVLRNYRFFGAPVELIVCLSRELMDRVAAAPLCAGLHLQTLLLALAAAGLGSCVQIAIAGFPDVVRAEVGIPPDLEILCGVAVGYEDPAAPINHCRIAREPVEKTTVWVEE